MKTAWLMLWGLTLAAVSSATVQQTHQIHATVRLHHGKVRGHAGCSKSGQLYRPISYIPSTLEKEWGEHISQSNEDACGFIRSNAPRVTKWLAAIRDFYRLELESGWPNPTAFLAEVPTRNETVTAQMSEDIFSRMIYENICPGEFHGMRKEIPVEPLIGHLRHPHALKECILDGKQQPDTVDPNYFLAVPCAAADLNVMFPGNKYLFDLGSSDFSSSVQYLTTRYRQAGIDFKQIWAWEVSPQDPKAYWDGVPDTYRQRVHFYNTPITDDFKKASHPLNIIRSTCEPGDLIVVKLDIDNGPLESAIMAEIGADPELRHCISEMFYEQHYNHADMAFTFGLTWGTTLSNVFKDFTRERQSGLLLHYWP